MGRDGRQQSLWLAYKSFSSFLCLYTPPAPTVQAGQLSQKAVLHQVATVQTHLVQQRDVLQSLTLPLSKSGAAGSCFNGALLRGLRAAEGRNYTVGAICSNI